MMKRIVFSLLFLLSCGLLPAQRFQLPSGEKQPGELRVLCIGNSFTYVHDTDVMLTQIAESQGLKIQIGKFLKGGQTFGQHLNLKQTQQAIAAGGYDFAFLQDQSSTPAKYSRDKDPAILEHFLELEDRVKAASPDCQIILERTWSYSGNKVGGFDTPEDLDKHLHKGVKKMARKGHAWMSPIGEAFNACRKAYPDIALLGDDDHHQSLEGAYLKACVNYLVITGKPFAGTVAECGVDPETAAALRKTAEKTVLRHERKYLIRR